MHFQSEYIQERGHLEDVVVDGRIILQDLKEVPFGEHTNSIFALHSMHTRLRYIGTISLRPIGHQG
jgi:hypothetical protein